MSQALPDPPLLLILDGFRPGTLGLLNAALTGGCRWISLRAPDLKTAQRSEAIGLLKTVCAPFDAMLSVHADIGAAVAAELAALHLPREGNAAAAREMLGEAALIGVSAHDRSELLAAEAGGADYATLSPVFATESKPGYGPALGVNGLLELARTVSLPVLALGGIDDAAKAAAAMRAGAAGLAVMGGLARQADPVAGTESLLAAIAQARGSP